MRDLPLPLHVARELKKWRVETPWNRPEDFVFASENGNPHDPRNIITHHLKPAAERAEVPWISTEKLRWTASSLTAQEGLNPLQQYRVLRLPLDPKTLQPSLADFEATRQAINRLDQKIFGNAEIPKAEVVTLDPAPSRAAPSSMLEESNRREQTDRRPLSRNESSQSVKLQAEKQAPTFYVDPSELPAVLKKARLVAGHSQEIAAEKVGIAKTALNRIETGKSKPRPSCARAIMDYIHSHLSS